MHKVCIFQFKSPALIYKPPTNIIMIKQAMKIVTYFQKDDMAGVGAVFGTVKK